MMQRVAIQCFFLERCSLFENLCRDIMYFALDMSTDFPRVLPRSGSCIFIRNVV